MRAAWRVASVRQAEEALMATLPEGALMQRAAAGLARRCAVLLTDRHGKVYGRSVLLLVGAGNNGGDALFAGAALARRGAVVTALLLAPDRAHRQGVAALRAAGGRAVDGRAVDGRAVDGRAVDGHAVAARTGPTPDPLSSTADLVVDGILGIGGRGGLREEAARAVRAAGEIRDRQGRRPPMVAVDLPSGVDPDTGAVEGEAVRADVTVTFGTLKPGLLIGAGAVHSGLVDVVDIGLGPWLRGDPALRVPDLADIAGWWPRPAAGDDKYTRGVVGLATGSATYPGAAVLSVAGATAGPVGMVRYAGAAADAVRFRFPSVISAERVADAGRVQAWVCGCGLGTDERASAELRSVLAAPVPVCLDADALTLLADAPIRAALRERTAPSVLTPHDREFARIHGAEPGADRVESALRLAASTAAVVLFKGDRTIVASPDGTAYVNPSGTPALATAGTGDVLAGLLGSLLAAGLPAERAALAAAYAHGLAGRRAAERGPVTSEQVAAALRGVIGRAGFSGPP